MDGVILPPRSGNITTEKINWQSTLLGGVAFVTAQIALRVIVLALLVLWVLAFGRWVGPFLSGIGCAKLLDITVQWRPFRIGIQRHVLKRKRRTIAQVILGVGTALMVAWIFNLWPQIWWDAMRGAGCSGPPITLVVGAHSYCVSALAMWLRVLFLAGLPFVFQRPLENLDWMLDIETRWPKARETGFGLADIESPAVSDPHSKIKRGVRPAGQSLVTIEQGASQEANPPDGSVPMKVGGV